MARYTVKTIEVVETIYEIEVEAPSEDQAKLIAEDIIVNHEDAAKAAIQSERQVGITHHARL